MTKVAVIIRTTGEKSKLNLLEATISSLVRQKFKDFSVIVVTCENKELIESFLTKNLPQYEHKVVVSPIRNRCVQSNMGIKIANSEYVAIIDDDMVLSSNWLEIMFNNIRNSPEKVACICSPVYPLYKIEDKSSNDVGTKSLPYLQVFRKFLRTLSLSKTFWPKNVKLLNEGVKELPTIPSNCVICKRTALVDVGFYDTSLREPLRSDDYALGFRLRKLGYKILSCDAVKAFHTENYLIKWIGKNTKFFRNKSLTEFYVLMKHRGFVGFHAIVFHALYRIIESLYWAYKNKKFSLILSVFKGVIEGIVWGFKAKQ